MIFGADIIAGFPTETQEQFQRSLALIDECGLTHLHVFPYSPREGTPAARMPQVPREIARDRAARLREKGEAALAAHLERQIGRDIEVLAERGGQGRARDFTLVHTPGVEAGAIFSARITGHTRGKLVVEARPMVSAAPLL
jgi:threonylcarbamoyladenosine tRNA methylthiotransferase MtaB